MFSLPAFLGHHCKLCLQVFSHNYVSHVLTRQLTHSFHYISEVGKLSPSPTATPTSFLSTNTDLGFDCSGFCLFPPPELEGHRSTFAWHSSSPRRPSLLHSFHCNLQKGNVHDSFHRGSQFCFSSSNISPNNVFFYVFVSDFLSFLKASSLIHSLLFLSHFLYLCLWVYASVTIQLHSNW